MPGAAECRLGPVKGFKSIFYLKIDKSTFVKPAQVGTLKMQHYNIFIIIIYLIKYYRATVIRFGKPCGVILM